MDELNRFEIEELSLDISLNHLMMSFREFGVNAIGRSVWHWMRWSQRGVISGITIIIIIMIYYLRMRIDRPRASPTPIMSTS